MAIINNRFIHFKYKSDFDSRYAETTDNGMTYGDFLGKSIVFIRDANKIWTHGHFYDCGGYDTPIEVTYSELRNLIENSQLIPKQTYHLTDYQSVYYSSTGGFNLICTGAGEEADANRGVSCLLGTDDLIGNDGVAHPSAVYTLELKAQNENTLFSKSKIIKVNGLDPSDTSLHKQFPINFADWEIEYDHTYFEEYGEQYKGWITYMCDKTSDNEFCYDVWNVVWWRTGREVATWGDTVNTNGLYLHTFNFMDTSFNYKAAPAYSMESVSIINGNAEFTEYDPDHNAAHYIVGFPRYRNFKNRGDAERYYYSGNNVFVTISNASFSNYDPADQKNYYISFEDIHLHTACASNTFVARSVINDIKTDSVARYNNVIFPNSVLNVLRYERQAQNCTIRSEILDTSISSGAYNCTGIVFQKLQSGFFIIKDTASSNKAMHIIDCEFFGSSNAQNNVIKLGQYIQYSTICFSNSIFAIDYIANSKIGQTWPPLTGQIVGTNKYTRMGYVTVPYGISMYADPNSTKSMTLSRIAKLNNASANNVVFMLNGTRTSIANNVVDESYVSGIYFYLNPGTGSAIYDLHIKGTCGFGSTAALYNAKKVIDISCDQGGMSVIVDLSPEVITVTRHYRTGETSVKLHKITSLPDFTE